jgi:hypothetical protein
MWQRIGRFKAERQSNHKNIKIQSAECDVNKLQVYQANRWMTDRLDEFLSQSKNARERAAASEGEFRRQWLKVAEMWELLAKEYRRIHNGAADD